MFITTVLSSLSDACARWNTRYNLYLLGRGASGNVAFQSNESPRRLTSRCTLAKKNEITQKGEVASGEGGRRNRRGGFFEESQFPLVETDNDPLPTTEYVTALTNVHTSTYLSSVFLSKVSKHERFLLWKAWRKCTVTRVTMMFHLANSFVCFSAPINFFDAKS